MKRTYLKRSELYSTPSLRPTIVSPIRTRLSSPATQALSASGSRPTFIRTVGSSSSSNTSSNDTNMAQKIEALEAMVKKIADENADLKSTVQALRSEVAELKDLQNQSNERAEELETIIKNRRNKVHTNAIFRSTPEMTAANVQVRFSSEIATFFLKDFINFDMENKALEEVGKLIAIKMFEQLIPEGCSLATFSISSTPRYGYITIPSNLFEELADKLVHLTQGHEDNDLKHAILLRINFGLNDKIPRPGGDLRQQSVDETGSEIKYSLDSIALARAALAAKEQEKNTIAKIILELQRLQLGAIKSNLVAEKERRKTVIEKNKTCDTVIGAQSQEKSVDRKNVIVTGAALATFAVGWCITRRRRGVRRIGALLGNPFTIRKPKDNIKRVVVMPSKFPRKYSRYRYEYDCPGILTLMFGAVAAVVSASAIYVCLYKLYLQYWTKQK